MQTNIFDKIPYPFTIKTLIRKKKKPLIKVNIEGTYLNIIKTIYDKSTANSKNLLFVLAPLCCSRDPNKALLEFIVWTLVNFHLLGKAKDPGHYPIYGTQCGAVFPFWEEDLGTSGTTEHSFPLGDKWPLEPLVSASPCLLRLPSQPLEASGPSFTKCFPLPLFFPTPGSSLFLPPLSSPLSVPTYSCPILLREWSWAATASLLSGCETCPFWLAMAPLEEWQAEVERLASHHAVPGSANSPLWEINESHRGLNFILCSGGQSYCPRSLTFILLLSLSRFQSYLFLLPLPLPYPYTCTLPFILKKNFFFIKKEDSNFSWRPR